MSIRRYSKEHDCYTGHDTGCWWATGRYPDKTQITVEARTEAEAIKLLHATLQGHITKEHT